MGLGEFLKRRYLAANGWFGKHGIIFAILLWFIVPASVGGLLAALALRLEWFWGIFGSFGIAMVVLFGWTFASVSIAANRALVLLRQMGQPPSPTPPAKKFFNFVPYKHMAAYAVSELSELLAVCDVASTDYAASRSGYQKLLFDAMTNNSLKYEAEKGWGVEGEYDLPPTIGAKIKKQDALAWAAEKNLNLDPIK